MPVVDTWAYFDHAAVAPLTAVARNAMVLWTNAVARNGLANKSRGRMTVERLRRLGAKLTGADSDEIAIVRNTTEGIKCRYVQDSIPDRPGAHIKLFQIFQVFQ